VRCAQVALDAGFRVKFIWLGSGEPSDDPVASEIIIPAADSFWQRAVQLPRIARSARGLSPAGWHIHDFYMLPFARRFSKATGTRVVYDVHEYYARYYSEKLPLPGWARRLAYKAIDSYQARMAERIGGANLVAAEMAPAFDRLSVPIAVSPNLPLRRAFDETQVAEFDERRKRAIHTGSLSVQYGMYLLLDVANECNRRGLDVSFDLVEKFSSAEDRKAFAEYFSKIGSPSNVRVIPMVLAHEIPDLLAGYGIGLSMILDGGQNEIAIPTKLYEYALMGLFVIGTDRAAQSTMIKRHAIGTVRDQSDVAGFVGAIEAIVAESSDVGEEVLARAMDARDTLVWEAGPASELRRLFQGVFSAPA
jgi:glycosyltransferase involved in cell wall biosynthesis